MMQRRAARKVDNHCYPYIRPSHCKDSHTLHIKSGSKLTQILNFKANFHQEFELFSINKIHANNDRHFKIVSIKKTALNLST